jgi:hypothetical protein
MANQTHKRDSGSSAPRRRLVAVIPIHLDYLVGSAAIGIFTPLTSSKAREGCSLVEFKSYCNACLQLPDRNPQHGIDNAVWTLLSNSKQ